MQIGQTATGSVQIIVEELIENKSNQKLLTPKYIGVPALPLLCVLSALCLKFVFCPKFNIFDSVQAAPTKP
jgi:hypothetical protein